jgi:hypothetical protein
VPSIGPPSEPALHEHRADAVADRHAVDACPHRDHLSDPVGDRDQRQRAGVLAVTALRHHQVAEIQRCGLHPQQHLARAGRRVGPRGEPQVLEPPVAFDLEHAHRRILSDESDRSSGT